MIAIFSLIRCSVPTFDEELFKKETESQKFDPKTIDAEIVKIKESVSSLRKDKDEVKRVISHIDLTTLAGDDTSQRVEALVDKALAPYPQDATIHTAAVCVYPARVTDVKNHLIKLGKDLRIASVAAGFPSGQYHIESRRLEVELAVADGATEIDIVLNRAAALSQDWSLVFNEVATLKNACGVAHMKTILATGELNSYENIYKASWASMMAGSDFIKTSTGFEKVNATLEAAYVMCVAIKRYHGLTGRKVGFKPAGGIRTLEDALGYRVLVENVLGKEWLTPELFRYGASSLLENVLKDL
ncbi:hypothetical protein AB6A40_001784 [Gnathostoma spinigerum]|uniref:deoxyribose-phosphate aldolase n=1 Tax=Gnathostoma spinigerum TaxID=75299 RepID=A0ABD6EFI9_9BILA